MFIRNYLPQSISSALWGNRKRWGLTINQSDICWQEWQRNYSKFYTENQRQGIGTRVNDSGYMIGRLFVNAENHFMVEGKRQMGFLYNDIINSIIDKDKMKAIIQSAVLYTLDLDLFIPPYDKVKEVSVFEIQQLSDKLKLKTAKRLGFQFNADSDSIE